MAKAMRPEEFGKALKKELTVYAKDVVERVNKESNAAVKKLAKITRLTAPKRTGRYSESIASGIKQKRRFGNVYRWYVKPPYHRLTHLLVNGHVTGNGGRTKSDPFLENALNTVLPEYESKVREAISSG